MKKSEEEFSWWAGKDEERMTIGPCATRQEAIDEGRSDFDMEAFVIMEAAHGVPSVPEADRFIEMFLDANEDLGDPDGDSYGADWKTTAEQEAELTADLSKVFTAWMDKHKLWPTVWCFGKTRNIEAIPEEAAPEDEGQDADEARDDKAERERLAKENHDDGS